MDANFWRSPGGVGKFNGGEFVRAVSSPVTYDSRLRFSPARSNSHLACGELASEVRHDEHSRLSIYSGSL